MARQVIELMFTGLLASKSGAEKCSYLLLYIGQQGRDIHNMWTLTNDQKKDPTFLLNKFLKYCEPRKNITLKRRKFFSRNQALHEPIDAYVTDLRLLSRSCEFGDIRDRIVGGTNSESIESIRKMLIKEQDLTLNRCLEFVRGKELSRQNYLSNSPNIQSITCRPTSGSRQLTARSRKARVQFSRADTKKCPKCGRSYSQSEPCPAKGKKCFNCKKMNHFSRMCRSRNVSRIEAEDKFPSGESTYFISCLNTTTGSDSHDEAFVSINLPDFDHNVKFKLDSGAQVNTMPRNVYSKFASMKNLQSSNSLLRAYGGSLVNSFGTVLLKCKHGDVVENLLFYVVDNLLPPLLGLKTCLSIGLLKILCPVKPETPLECNSLLDKYSDLFKGIGCLAQPYTILTDNNVTQVRFPPRRIPFALTDKVKAELDSMVAQDVIEPVSEHSD